MRDPRIEEIQGDRLVRSDHPLVRALDVRVGRMYVNWRTAEVEAFCG